MKYAILGTGGVGRTISAKLISLGHDVMMGTRNVEETKSRTKGDNMGNPSFQEWFKNNAQIKLGTFAEATAFGEVLVNGLTGFAALEVLQSVAAADIEGKILIDIANPLDFSKGFPPTLTVANTDSLGEQIQRAFPSLKVVKTLNTLSNVLMVDPQLVNGGDHTIFICGNNDSAKISVVSLLNSFGWKNDNVIDLGDITNARGTEMLLPIWIRLFGKFQTPMFQIKIVK